MLKLEYRIINIRVMFAVFCGLMVGIFFPFLLVKGIVDFATLITLTVIMFLVALGFFVYAEATRKYNLTTEYRKDVSALTQFAVVGFLLAFVIGGFVTMPSLMRIFKLTDYGNTEVEVTGVVSDYVQSESSHKKFIIDNCAINVGMQHYSTDYKICVYSTAFLDIELGDIITFSAVLDKNDFFRSIEFTQLIQNIGYTTFIDSSDTIVTEGNLELKDIVKQNTKDLLDVNLNEDNAGISYAILFGEKQGLSDNIKDMFSYAGISHILAVSGLHIGVLVSLLYFVLKKLKVNRFVRLIILGVILLFYSYLCSFTPSVCRASIMALLVAFCDCIYVEYDYLSGLSIAGIIILLFNPMALFSISFQLSFLCVFAIISLAPTLTRLLKKAKLPEFLASAIAVSVATNIVILPVCINVFDQVSLLGIIANILVLPVFSFVYILLFACVLLGLILPGLGIFLYLPNLFLHIVKVVANYISSLGFGVFRVFNISYWALFLICLLTLTLHFLMIRKFYKFVIIATMLVFVSGLFVDSITTNNYFDDNLLFSLKYNSNSCYYVNDNKVTLIGSNVDSKTIIRDLKNFRIKNIDTIIAYDFELNDIENFDKIVSECGVKRIYLPINFEYDYIKDKYGDVIFYSSNVIIDNMKLNSIIYDDQIIGITLDINEIGKILIPEIKPTKAESQYLMENYSDYEIVYVNSDNIKLNLLDLKPKLIISNEDCALGDIELEEIDYYVLNKRTIEEFV